MKCRWLHWLLGYWFAWTLHHTDTVTIIRVRCRYCQRRYKRTINQLGFDATIDSGYEEYHR